MKTFLICLIVLYLIQILLLLMTIYFMRRDIETIGDLINKVKKIHCILWIPIVGLIMNLCFIVYELSTCIWRKIAKIRIR